MRVASLVVSLAVVVTLSGCVGKSAAEKYLEECLAQEKVLTQLEINRDNLDLDEAMELMLEASNACYEEAGLPIPE